MRAKRAEKEKKRNRNRRGAAREDFLPGKDLLSDIFPPFTLDNSYISKNEQVDYQKPGNKFSKGLSGKQNSGVKR
jgi:hypothetical protein